MKKILIALFILALSIAAADAQTTWKPDIAHSKVSFNVSHMVISEVTGRFTEFDATLVQTADDFSKSKLTAKIKVNSINTDNESRDKHLRTGDFFDADKYPDIIFTSSSFEKTGKDKYKISGDLTMHGVTKKVVLDAKFNGQMVDPWGTARAGFKANGTINRKDFGIEWNKALETGGLLVGEDVEIVISVEMTQEKTKN